MGTRNTIVIAEAGVNHNGSLKMAFDLVDAAVDAGADYVKFQTFKTENLVSKYVKKAEYQERNSSQSKTQYEMLKKLELSNSDFREISDYCREKKIKFFSTAFDAESLNYLVEDIKIDLIKIPSGEISNFPFLLQMAKYKLPMLLSTGMSSLGDIELALGALAYGLSHAEESPSPMAFKRAYFSKSGQENLMEFVTLLHCTSEYPAKASNLNLRAISTLSQAFELAVGYSDHSEGLYAALAAVTLGARVVEKHLTLDKNLSGPDHSASSNPKEFKEMVLNIRNVEKALGSQRKIVADAEELNSNVARKVLVAAQKINSGDIFSNENLTVKRAGAGISPLFYWSFLGKNSSKNYELDEIIE